MSERLEFRIDRLATPVGELLIVADAEGRLRAIDWSDYENRMRRLLDRYYGAGRYAISAGRGSRRLTTAMSNYFDGDTAAIDKLPVETSGTSFQRGVWQALRGIPAGTTISYAELALRIGNPRAVRAAGFANGQNPISIVLPCHRVIGSNGTLTGYGGGLPRKKWLLEHEGAL